MKFQPPNNSLSKVVTNCFEIDHSSSNIVVIPVSNACTVITLTSKPEHAKRNEENMYSVYIM